jgi:choline dehydrogenase-like flavoprotein
MFNEAEINYDVCIVGSGPAGIIVALEYSRVNPDKRVLLIEYGVQGQHGNNQLDDSIEIKNKVNHHDPYECTNKGLGGTSATWGGRCVMYDEVDFLDRPIVRHGCTWRYELFEELKKYLAPTADYFECGQPVFNLNDLPKFGNQRVSENFSGVDVTDSVLERWSMPTRFGKRYAKELARQSNLTFIEGVEARNFSAPDDAGNVGTLQIRKVGTEVLTEIKAKFFVLAAGAQETTRILLRNRQLFN